MTSLEQPVDAFTDRSFSRRSLLKAGGALVVGTALPTAVLGGRVAGASAAVADLDPTQLASWIAIQADNTVLVRTGKVDIGNGMLTGLQQIVADELYVPFNSIKLVFGDTDKTAGGGYTAGGTLSGEGTTLRRVAAYARQSLLELGSKKLGVPVASLSVKNGVVSGGGGSATYASLVAGQVLNVVIPTSGTASAGSGVQVLGTPPLKNSAEYEFVGKSVPRIDIPTKANGSHTYVGDIKLDGLLHGRLVRPKTLGSTLVTLGTLPKKQFPNAQVVAKGNLVGVVSSSEWEAINAAEVLAKTTTWSDWAGLPGSGNLEKAIRSTSVTYRASRNTGDAFGTIAKAAKVVSGSYMTPYTHHATIGPYVATADVRSGGEIHVWSNTSTPQGLRSQVATMMGVPRSNVVVHWVDGTSQYGRTSLGGDDPVADAVVLSSLVGKPVRVQWGRFEDHIWANKSIPQIHDGQIALDASGKISAWRQVTWSVPLTDTRMLGAILAGLPGPAQPAASGGYGATWIYDLIPNVLLEGRGSPYFGSDAPNKVGIRSGIFRSPGDYQSVFGTESLMNEAAAATGADPLDFRRKHVGDARGLAVLDAVAKAANWQSRPSPSGAKAKGNLLTGRGVALSKRAVDGNAAAGPGTGTWVAVVADISVNQKTGKIQVAKMTCAYDCGYVVNPEAVLHTIESGILQGASKALHEEVTFDREKILSKDWVSYPILRPRDTPEIEVVLVGNVPTASSAAAGEPIMNPIAAAITGAFYDATGKFARKLPLRPANVKAILKA